MSTAGDTGEGPRIGALLRAAHEVVSATVRERTVADGHPELHPSHFRLLQYPGVEGVRPTDLARRLDTTKQAINPLLNDLQDWGYITREADAHDRRGRVIRLTARGHGLMRTIRGLHAEIEADWSERLGQRRFNALRATLERLVEIEASAPLSRLR